MMGAGLPSVVPIGTQSECECECEGTRQDFSFQLRS